MNTTPRHCWNCKVITYHDRYCADCEKDFATIAQVGAPVSHNDSRDNGTTEKETIDVVISLADASVVCMATTVACGVNSFCSLCGAFPTYSPGAYGKGNARQCAMGISRDESVDEW